MFWLMLSMILSVVPVWGQGNGEPAEFQTPPAAEAVPAGEGNHAAEELSPPAAETKSADVSQKTDEAPTPPVVKPVKKRKKVHAKRKKPATATVPMDSVEKSTVAAAAQGSVDAGAKSVALPTPSAVPVTPVEPYNP
jgi:hypothetical protein